MTVEPDVLTRLKPVAYDKVRRMVRDGDLLLCSATDPLSKLIRWATPGPWSHVAIAFRIEELDRVMVLECVEHLGVRVVPLTSFISRTSAGTHPYPGKIVLARHDGFDDGKMMKKMAKFAFDKVGDRFSQGELIKIIVRIVAGKLHKRLPRHLGPKDAFICSEFVARCYAEVGIKIPWDGFGFIAPGDFAADPALKPVAQIRTR